MLPSTVSVLAEQGCHGGGVGPAVRIWLERCSGMHGWGARAKLAQAKRFNDCVRGSLFLRSLTAGSSLFRNFAIVPLV